MIRVDVPDSVLTARRTAMEAKGNKAWQPKARNRVVSAALRAYALLTTSAANGAVRSLENIDRQNKARDA